VHIVALFNVNSKRVNSKGWTLVPLKDMTAHELSNYETHGTTWKWYELDDHHPYLGTRRATYQPVALLGEALAPVDVAVVRDGMRLVVAERWAVAA
jgi:hypothetical protein